jgi:hypothetical protein
MSIVGLLIVLLLVGVVLAYLPIDAKIRNIIAVIILVLVVLELCEMFGVLSLDLRHLRAR